MLWLTGAGEAVGVAAAQSAQASQTAPAAPADAPLAPDAADAPATPRERPEPAIDRRVIEDDGVRIEELRVRGQLVRVTVQSKLAGVPPYEVNVGAGGRDPSQERGRAGQSAWRLFSF
jgi:hypothetical protein